MEVGQDGASAIRSSPVREVNNGISPFARALLAGAVAGTAVDLSLFPIDTLKTRLQSSAGFRASGGFRGIYAGVGSAALGAAPGAAFFFVSYEASKDYFASLRSHMSAAPSNTTAALEHMCAASIGEIAACAVRVPTEVVKQRAQAGAHESSVAAVRAILAQRPTIGLTGVWGELYRGWTITVMREVPFTVVQFPLWEAMKRSWQRSHAKKDDGIGREGSIAVEPIGAVESGLFGSLSGAVAAAVTTPLDVLKTRMMLSTDAKPRVSQVFQEVIRTSGPRGLLAGIGPRVAWISAGGAIFLGSYQSAYNALAAW